MAEQAVKLVSAINTVNATQASLDTFFAQIDELERNVSAAEQHNAWGERRSEKGGRALTLKNCSFFASFVSLQLTELEAVVAQLDLYSKRLHFTFTQIYK